MTELPTELTIIPEDTEGEYNDSYDCTIARALKRAGVFLDKEDGYYVTVFGGVVGSDHKIVGEYKWKETGEEFCNSTARDTGTLVLEVRRSCRL